jgi:hypothetical protein
MFAKDFAPRKLGANDRRKCLTNPRFVLDFDV